MCVALENRIEAAAIFRAILAGAGHVGGKLLALQATTRLCKLEMLEGKAEQSGRTLKKIYDSFTEGFETFDLQAAKAVLKEWQN